MTRILVYTGKGGVGKTSVAAATALACADRGYRTIVMSTDIAHSLGDAFDRELGPTPLEIAPNLWAQESDVFFNVARYWGRIQEYAASVLRWRGLDEVMAEEMTVLPGMDEVGSLLWIADHHDSGNYDVVVVDAAPTGETLRLLSLPEAAKWWMEKIEPIGRRIAKLTGPLIQRVVGMPMPGDDVFNAGEELFARLDHMHALLTDHEKTSVRVVLTLEQVVIKEAQRSFTYFHLYDYPTDMVVANRVLPDDVGAYFRGWYEAQQRYGPLVEKTFHPIPVQQGAVLRSRDGRHRPPARAGRQRCTATPIRPSSSTAAARTRWSATTAASCVSVDLPFTEKDQHQPVAPRRRARHRPRHLAPHTRPAAHPGRRPDRGRALRGQNPQDPVRHTGTP